jgi:hypothetical protein
MHDPTNGSRLITVNTAEGERIFKKCTPSDRIAFANAFRLYRKMKLIENMKLLGVPDDEYLKRLNEFDAQLIPDEAAIRWIEEPHGQFEAVLLSLRHDNPKAGYAEVSALGLDRFQLFELAAKVMNLKLVPKGKAAAGGGGDSRDPLPDSARGTTATGATMPTSSEPGTAPPTTP